MKKIYGSILLLLLPVLLTAQGSVGTDLIVTTMNAKRLELMPITKDFRNYFVLQVIEDRVNIVIADFVGAERKTILITDDKCDGKIDEVFEYYPDMKKLLRPSKTTSDLFLGLEKTKKKIIDGTIFKEGYSYNMRSIDVLKEKLIKGSDIIKYEHGYTVKVYDPDNPSSIMSEYFFGRKDGTYDLKFKTNYYKLYNTTIKPPIAYSVFCERTTDSYIKEVVEDLIKIVERK